MKHQRDITPQVEFIDIRQDFMAGSNILDGVLSEIEFNYETMDEGDGSDMATREDNMWEAD